VKDQARHEECQQETQQDRKQEHGQSDSIGYKEPFQSVTNQLHHHINHPSYRGEQIDRSDSHNQKVESLMKIAIDLVVN
jgi:hypothetical protein